MHEEKFAFVVGLRYDLSRRLFFGDNVAVDFNFKNKKSLCLAVCVDDKKLFLKNQARMS